MSEKFENPEMNEQELGQATGGKSSGVKVYYICRGCRAAVAEWYESRNLAPAVRMIHCPECGHLTDADLRDW